MQSLKILPDILGMLGVSFVLGTYLLLQLGKLSIQDLYYSVFNLLGAVLILISLLFHWNLSSVIIEVVWFGISAYGLIKYYRARKC